MKTAISQRDVFCNNKGVSEQLQSGAFAAARCGVRTTRTPVGICHSQRMSQAVTMFPSGDVSSSVFQEFPFLLAIFPKFTLCMSEGQREEFTED